MKLQSKCVAIQNVLIQCRLEGHKHFQSNLNQRKIPPRRCVFKTISIKQTKLYHQFLSLFPSETVTVERSKTYELRRPRCQRLSRFPEHEATKSFNAPPLKRDVSVSRSLINQPPTLIRQFSPELDQVLGIVQLYVTITIKFSVYLLKY